MTALTHLAKWKQTMVTSISRTTAYRLDFALMVIGPSLVFFFIKYNLWSTIFSGREMVNGYTFDRMITYQAMVLMCSFLTQSQTAAALDEEIRMGRVSNYLIYPFSFYKHHLASFMGYQVVQTFIVLFTTISILVGGLVPGLSIVNYLLGLFSCYVVSLLWFNMQYLTGIMGFWLEETWIMRVCIKIAATFLSGSFIPLVFFPQWLQDYLPWTPFPYMAAFPIKVFLGQSVEWGIALGVMGTWTLLFMIVNQFIWRRGLRLYTAAGM